MNEGDALLSYLPLAHIFERMAEETFLNLGARIAYWQGDVKQLVDDISAAKPTVFVGVPRIFDRIYTGVLAKARSHRPSVRPTPPVPSPIPTFFPLSSHAPGPRNKRGCPPACSSSAPNP